MKIQSDINQQKAFMVNTGQNDCYVKTVLYALSSDCYIQQVQLCTVFL